MKNGLKWKISFLLKGLFSGFRPVVAPLRLMQQRCQVSKMLESLKKWKNKSINNLDLFFLIVYT